VPANNDCSTATGVESFPFNEKGETIGATEEADETIGEDCGLIIPSSQIIWYEWVGDGSCSIVSTEGSDFDTVLGVYTGDACSNLTCVAENDDIGLVRSSEVAWQTEPGVRYKLALGAAFGFGAGFYNLSITVSSSWEFGRW
jgi:hypothetical protein